MPSSGVRFASELAAIPQLKCTPPASPARLTLAPSTALELVTLVAAVVVAVGAPRSTASNAPMSQVLPRGRVVPRASVAGQLAMLPPLSAGLPCRSSLRLHRPAVVGERGQVGVEPGVVADAGAQSAGAVLVDVVAEVVGDRRRRDRAVRVRGLSGRHAVEVDAVAEARGDDRVADARDPRPGRSAARRGCCPTGCCTPAPACRRRSRCRRRGSRPSRCRRPSCSSTSSSLRPGTRRRRRTRSSRRPRTSRRRR